MILNSAFYTYGGSTNVLSSRTKKKDERRWTTETWIRNSVFCILYSVFCSRSHRSGGFIVRRFARAAQPISPDGPGVLRAVRAPDRNAGQRTAGCSKDQSRRRSVCPRRAGKDPAELRALAREDSAQAAYHRHGRTGYVQDREHHLRSLTCRRSLH